MTLDRGPVCLAGLVNEVLDTYSIVFSEKHLQLKKDIPPSLPPISGHRDRLLQVLNNLIDNCLKFTPANGCITVRVQEKLRELRLEIQDSGPGIAAEHLEKIFDKFERVTANKEEGTGLGLPIARDIAMLHNGKL